MKKILSCLALLVLLASPVFASVGINVNGTTIGTAGNIYVTCPTGASEYIDGFNYSATCSSTLVADGTYNGGYTSLGTIDSGISLTQVMVEKAIQGTSGGTTADTLPNGTPNQMFTILIGTASSGSWTVTPTTSGAFASIVYNTQGQRTTFLYVNSTVGWIVLSNDAGNSGSPATIVVK